jgi:hypothetical protein
MMMHQDVVVVVVVVRAGYQPREIFPGYAAIEQPMRMP